MKNNIGKIIIVLIIIALIVSVGVLLYHNKQEEEIICTVEGETDINTTVNYENTTNSMNIQEENKTSTNQNSDEVPEDMTEYYISIGKWKKFEFNTPVGQDGKFEIYAEKAVQARGFSGASAHIYYLREGELYYHNHEQNDIKLASGITDLKTQGEDIIAVKGEGTTLYVENQYIQYE